MPNLIRRAAKYRLQLCLLIASILVLVIGLPMLNTSQKAEASNPALGLSVKVYTLDGEESNSVDEGDPATLAVDVNVSGGGAYVSDGMGGMTEVDSVGLSAQLVGPGIDVSFWRTYSVMADGSKTQIDQQNASPGTGGTSSYRAPFPDDSDYICVELVIPPHGVCWRAYYSRSKACLVVCDVISGGDKGECRGDGEKLKLKQDASGIFKVELKPEVVPANKASEYIVKITGLPAGWLDENGTVQQDGVVSFPADQASTFEFTLPKGFLETANMIARIDRVDGNDSTGLCQIYLSATHCESCTSGVCKIAAEGGSDAQNGFSAGMESGNTENGRGSGGLETHADDISPDLAKPASLSANASSGATVTHDGNGDIGSIATENGTTEVEDVITSGGAADPGYTLKFYRKQAGGTLDTTPTTQLKVIVPEVTAGDPKVVRNIEQRYNNDPANNPNTYVESKWVQDTVSETEEIWTFYEGAEVSGLGATASDNDFLRKTERHRKNISHDIGVKPFGATQVDTRAYPSREDIVTVSEKRADNGQWEIISRAREIWVEYPWGLTLVERTDGYGSRNLTTKWDYHVDKSHGNASGRLRSMERYDGYWEQYTYNSDGRRTKLRRPFLNSAPTASDSQCEVIEWQYGVLNNFLVHETRRILGTVVSESYTTQADTATFTVRTRKRLTIAGGGPGTANSITETVESVKPGLVLGTGNPIASSGEVVRRVYADGTEETCSYSYSGSNRIRTCRRGALVNGSGTINAGVMTVTTTDALGNPISTVTSALDAGGVAGTTLELKTDTQANLDTLGRPRTFTTAFADGSTTQVSTLLYGCCGLRESTDIRGITTLYHFDHLKRQETATSIGVTHATQYNGLTRKNIRIPEAVAPTDSHGHITVRGMLNPPSGAIVQSDSGYSTAREMLTAKSPSPQHADGTTLVTTSYSYTYGTGTTTVADYPDGGQSTTVTARDGRSLESYGSAITGNDTDKVLYEYGPTITGITFGNGGVFGTKVTQANGTQWSASVIDLLGRGVETHFADGNKASMHYNSLNQLVRSVDPDGVTSLYAYNDEGERTQRAADLNGNNSIETATDRVTFSETNATTGHDGTTRVWETVSRVYGTSGGNLQTGQGQRSIDGLKSWNIPFAITARASSSATVLAGGGDWTSTSISSTGLTSVATYTGGLLDNSITRGADSVETLNSTSYFYDAHNRVNKTTDARTGDTTVVYLNNDQQSSVTQVRAGSNSLTTAFSYDSMGRTLTTNSPDSVDNNGTTLANVVTRSYDKRGNVLTVDGDQTYKRDYSYDELSRLTTLKTFGTQTSVTSWNYNAQRGWLDNKKYPDVSNPLQQGVGTTYGYTGGGRLKSRTWARGVTSTYHYDFEGNNPTIEGSSATTARAGDLQGVTYSDSTPDVSYLYQQWGAVSAINDITGTRTFVYREAIDLNLGSEKLSTNGTSLTQQQVAIVRESILVYDSLGRRIITKMGGSSLLLNPEHCYGYAYDAQTGRMQTITHGSAGFGIPEAPFTCNYVANSNLPESTTGPAHKVTNTYEAHRNVLKAKTNDDLHTTVATVSAITYGATTDAVNGIGQRDYASRSSSATYNAVTNTETWKYNTKGEVVDANHSANTKDRTFAYDGIGNRTSLTDNLGTISYTPNALNQYTAVGANSPVHDLDGNLTDDGTKLYTWDAENRLVTVRRKSDSAVIAEYRYDYMHRRIYKETTVIAPQGAGSTLFVYDGWNLCAEYEASPIVGSVDSTITSLKRTYTWGMDLSGSMQGAGGVGGLLVIEEKAGTHAGRYYPLYDGNGNVTELVKEGGTTGTTLVAHYEYDPFGNLTQNDNSDSSGYNAVNPYKFSTKYHDEETDFYYYGYRYYDPVTGRWPSRDPIEETGGYNLYGMAGNDVVNHWDVLGLNGSSILRAIQNYCQDPCDRLKGKIARLAKELGRKLDKYNPETDGQRHPISPGRGGGRGSIGGITVPKLTKPFSHYEAIQKQQKALKALIEKYQNKCPDHIRIAHRVRAMARAFVRVPRGYRRAYVDTRNGLTHHSDGTVTDVNGDRVIPNLPPIPDGVIEGALAGAALAAAAGSSGPQVLVPEEVVTVPAAAIAGAIVGAFAVAQ